LLQHQGQINGDNLNNVRCEASRHFRHKKKAYLKGKINELATNSKNKNIGDLLRGVNAFKGRYQPRSNLQKGENGDLWVGWGNYAYNSTIILYSH
jgi:hypothetical protein